MLKIIPPTRVADAQGQGHYGAPRGDRTHVGIDYACWPDSQILAASAGTVSKVGYPYDPNDEKKGHLRYVEVTSPLGYKVRYFYIHPEVAVGDMVCTGDLIGTSQDLRPIYKGITPHVHVEVKQHGMFLDPSKYLGESS